MASFTAGKGSKITVSDNGSGKVRVTFPSCGFDWELYDDMATNGSHYLYNQTTDTSVAIIGKGCTDATATSWAEKDVAGFYFDIDANYPDADWNTNDRAVPTEQAAANDYSTIDLAEDVMSVMDTMIVWFADTDNARQWYRQTITTAINVRGGLSRQLVTVLLVNQDFYKITGDLSVQTSQCYVKNLTVIGGYSAFSYMADSGKGGAGFKISRIISIAALRCTMFRANSTKSFVENCIQIGGLDLLYGYQSTSAHEISYCTAYLSRVEYTANIVFRNCLFWDPGTSSVVYNNGSTFNYCGFSDSGVAGVGNIINLTRDNLDLWQDNDNNIYSVNPRILTTSSLFHAGTPVDGIDVDIDGNTRHATTPSQGAHEGTIIAYPTPAPVVPQSLSATADDYAGSIIVQWSNSSDYNAGDFIYVYNASDDSVVGYLDATLGFGSIYNLIPGTTYTIYAKASAYGVSFSSATSNVQVTTGSARYRSAYIGTTTIPTGAPSTPTGLAATDAVTNGEIVVTWTNSGSYSSTDLMYIYNDSDDSILAITEASDGTIVVSGLTNDTQYTVYAKATSNAVEFSAKSSTASATPTFGVVVLAPTISATPGNASVTVNITANSQSDTIDVYYKTETATSFTSGGSRVGSGTISISSLTNGTLYEFIAIARQNTIKSTPSNVARATPASSVTIEDLAETVLCVDITHDDWEAEIL